ncbi:S-formylglutathione hydrolase [Synechococcus elongatus]|uniref:S-formylglutathione hydrolase n=1 Tax=Synechococcus elongatus TaxID=32046 RepID=UPI000F7E24E6|nr:S-formylglutathione hydrolase [Synechococcus elongatus]
MELLSSHRSFGGWQQRYRFKSTSLNSETTLSVYLPPQAEQGSVPLLYWLSGLTCTDENFVTKAGAQRAAAELGLAIAAPDTSPRGTDIADDAGWDLGQGAGFYVDATQDPWRSHYQMATYVRDELPALLAAHFPAIDCDRAGISGHSMGGHGALTLALNNPDRYRSASAFAPITAPSQCPWGEKALTAYLGSDRSAWLTYDACECLKTSAWDRPILVDQGEADEFLAGQLLPQQLEQAAQAAGKALTLRYQPDYNHSYFFIASFIDDHLRFHAEQLGS